MAASPVRNSRSLVVRSHALTAARLSRASSVQSSRNHHDVVFFAPFIGAILPSRTSSSLPGGAETQILMLSKALAKRGLRVAIVVLGDPSTLPEDVEGVRIIPRLPYKWGNKGIFGKLLEVVCIWEALWRAPSRTVVYRCASIELGLIGLYTALARRRLVFSTANVSDFEFRKLARKARDVHVYRLGVRLANAIVVQTEEQIAMCEATFNRRPYLIKSLCPLAECTREEPEAFLWVGRLVSPKQPLEYVRLARAVPDARFWMVGVPPRDVRERPVEDEVRAAARETSNLELLAPRSHAEMGKLMARAVASVNTAKFEGMPNVLLEAWSRGVPALVLHHDPGGVVTKYRLGGFAEGSPETLAELAREQWDSRHDRSELAQRSRAYIAAHHAPDAVATRWLELLTSLHTGPRPMPPSSVTSEDGPHAHRRDGDRSAPGSSGTGDERIRSIRLSREY
ncbi:MAG: glycosyltransferase family 4 protein [Solirubrobacteraceae bacterium]